VPMPSAPAAQLQNLSIATSRPPRINWAAAGSRARSRSP
jgi:hypothetical protein